MCVRIFVGPIGKPGRNVREQRHRATPGTVGAVAVAIQTDGKLVVAGGFPTPGASTTGLAVARYNTNGSLDSAFGSGGLLTSSSHAAAFAMTLQQDQKILIAVPGPASTSASFA
jgi:hypothetical protein